MLITKVKKALKEVVDPGTNLDVWSMRLIKDLKVDENTGMVNLTFRPTSPNCPLAYTLGLNIKKKIKEIEGINGINIDVVGYVNSHKLKEILSDE